MGSTIVLFVWCVHTHKGLQVDLTAQMHWFSTIVPLDCITTLMSTSPDHYEASGGSLPLIFCIHVRSGPIYRGAIYLAEKIIRYGIFQNKGVMVFYM